MELKQQIIIRYLNGDGQRKIAKDLHISRNTIRKYVNEYNSKKQELISNNTLTNTNEIIEDITDAPKYNSSNRLKRVLTDEILDIIENCLLENKQKKARRTRQTNNEGY